MPNGSYTLGQQSTAQCEYNSIASCFDTICSIHTIFEVPGPAPAISRAASTFARISAAISGVSGAPAHSTTCVPAGRYLIASTRCVTPFCRVMRPTNNTYGRVGSTPYLSSASWCGVY